MSNINEDLQTGDRVIISVFDYDRPIPGNYYGSKNVIGKIITSRVHTPKKGFINHRRTETIEYAVKVGKRIYWCSKDEITKI